MPERNNFFQRYSTNIGAITGTILGYEYAKRFQKDTFYYTILGGFVGIVIANATVDIIDDG